MFLDKEDSILFLDNHLLVVNKPAGMLTQPDQSGDESLEDFAKQWIKQKFQKPGAVFLHAIHRLDKVASGLVLFARTSKALSRLNIESRNQKIDRTYQIEVEGIIKKQEGMLEHYLIHGDHIAIIGQKTDAEAKLARLFFKLLRTTSNSTLIEVKLETGRYHQIRAQFAAIGHPIVGDRRYGSRQGDGSKIALCCTTLCFKHPITHEEILNSVL